MEEVLIAERLARFDMTHNEEEIVGIKKVTMPTISHKTATVSGSGIMGEYETPVLGQLENMEFQVDTTHVDPETAASLAAPGTHEFMVYAAVQTRTRGENEIGVGRKLRYYIKCNFKSTNEGDLENDADLGSTITFNVAIYRKYVDGTLMCDVNPLSSRYLWNGVDYYAEVNNAVDL